MSIKVVSNATPLIALSRIGRLDVLKKLFGTLIIPEAVFSEVAADGKKRAGSKEVASADWVRRQEVANTTVVDFLSVTVDAGEAEAIALAKEIKADLLLIDDREGRKLAESVGIPIAGTIGLLLRYYRGDPGSFKLALDELISEGFRVGEREYGRFIKLAEEYSGKK